MTTILGPRMLRKAGPVRLAIFSQRNRSPETPVGAPPRRGSCRLAYACARSLDASMRSRSSGVVSNEQAHPGVLERTACVE